MDDIKVYLAPMAGITDAAMREVCVEQGAQMSFTEMVSAKGIAYKDKKTGALLQLSPLEEQAGVQLFGSEPAVLADTAKVVEDSLGERLAEINLNMGCPAPKIVNNGEGCALMRDIRLSASLIRAVKAAVQVPVTVKIRKGWDEGSVNAVEFAKMAEEAGVDAVTVHGRTRGQFYAGKADWNVVRAVKRAVSTKVIGSGDIFSAQDAADMLASTGCDAVMVARGAIGNPFIFAQIHELLDTGAVQTIPTWEQKVEMCLRQARLAMEYKGEHIAMLEMRGQAPYYTKGIRGGARLREKLVKTETYAQLEAILKSIGHMSG